MNRTMTADRSVNQRGTGMGNTRGKATGANRKSTVEPGGTTMIDIARNAGVSIKTVSRVVNGESGVSESTRGKVMQVIRETGYFPHTGARSMRTQSRDCMGVNVSAPVEHVPINHLFFLQLFTEMYRIFGSRGTYVNFDLNPFAESLQGNYGRGLWEQRCGGIVVVGPLAQDDTLIEPVHQSGRPYLVMGRSDRVANLSCAIVDFEEAAYISTRCLLDLGHKRVALLAGMKGYYPALERQRGYLRAHEDAGISPDPALAASVGLDARELVNASHRLLLDRSVTAMVDSSGAEDGSSLREGSHRAGRTLGKDVDVVSWTYTYNATVLAEAKAHVWLPVWEATVMGLEELAKWFYGEKDGPVHVLLRPTLMETVDQKEIERPKPLFERRI
ncbi:MAG: LacI family transcriptional regulator [Candidatus Hydrogenedentota bacterium]